MPYVSVEASWFMNLFGPERTSRLQACADVAAAKANKGVFVNYFVFYPASQEFRRATPFSNRAHRRRATSHFDDTL